MRDYKSVLKEVKGESHIVDIPIEEFENLSDLENFVKGMTENGIGVVLHDEHSNFHQGVLVQMYDKETCTVKDYLCGGKRK